MVQLNNAKDKMEMSDATHDKVVEDDEDEDHVVKSVVDRTVVPVLKHMSKTPSSCNNVSCRVERLHRLHGTSLIADACELLRMENMLYATACTIFHRLYHRISLREVDVWSVAMASLLLSSKIEEEPQSLRSILLVFVHLYRKRLLFAPPSSSSITEEYCNDEGLLQCISPSSKAYRLTDAEKEHALRNHMKPLSPISRPFKEWKEALTKTENILLRQLGFTLYWIPDSHPHKFLLYFIRVLEIDHPKIGQMAWNYCNDSCRLDLCVRYEPEVVACAAIYLSCCREKIALPKSWWQTFIGINRDLDLSNACNAILSLCSPNISDMVLLLANHAFVTPLTEDCFNAPESFLWFYAE